ncbi:hypothetical protein GGS20DRAFT_572790 [Poronia punctata]|nr:hypothetical protein GGS20DRAFT_572790 [Poronia punctata]
MAGDDFPYFSSSSLTDFPDYNHNPFILDNIPSRQQRSSITKRKGTSFLDLPPNVRELIYRHAHLRSGLTIRLAPNDSEPEVDISGLPPCPRGVPTLSLLRVCKELYTEVRTFLFVNNAVIVSTYDLDYGLDYVGRMTPEDCANLRKLQVQLYVINPVPLDCFALTPKRISAWKEMIRHVLSHTAPKTLSLQLVCNKGDSAETESVLEPLLASPGMLKSIELEIGSERDDKLISLVRERGTCIEGRDNVDPDGIFPFLDLPTELRSKVLEYTDLVTPYGQVEWESVHGFYVYDPAMDDLAGVYADDIEQDSDMVSSSGRRRYDGPENLLDGRLHRAMKFLNCKTASHSFRSDNFKYCMRRNSTYSAACNCWIPPSSLMLVCRAMYEDAIRIFYSRNRIIIMPPERSFDTPLSPSIAPLRLEPSRFITRHMYPHVLQHLRRLEIVFPEIDPGFRAETAGSLYPDWLFAIDHLRQHANLSVLTINIQLSCETSKYNDEYNIWHGSVEQQQEEMLQPHLQLLRPLQALRDIAALFIYLEGLWHWATYRRWTWLDWDGEGRLCRRRPSDTWQFEAWLEQRIMGEDYRSWGLGKRKPRQPSEWMKTEIRSRKDTRF